jgi:hypothetical protein
MSKEPNEHQQDMEIADRVMRDNREALSSLADTDQQTEQMDLARKFMRDNRDVLRELAEGSDEREAK